MNGAVLRLLCKRGRSCFTIAALGMTAPAPHVERLAICRRPAWQVPTTSLAEQRLRLARSSALGLTRQRSPAHLLKLRARPCSDGGSGGDILGVHFRRAPGNLRVWDAGTPRLGSQSMVDQPSMLIFVAVFSRESEADVRGSRLGRLRSASGQRSARQATGAGPWWQFLAQNSVGKISFSGPTVMTRVLGPEIDNRMHAGCGGYVSGPAGQPDVAEQ